jgi:hypothetical protein
MRDEGFEFPRSGAWVEDDEGTDPGRNDGHAGTNEGSPQPPSVPSQPNYRWRNAMADWRLSEAMAHLDDAVGADPSPPARQAIAAARMHLVRAQSYLRGD